MEKGGVGEGCHASRQPSDLPHDLQNLVINYLQRTCSYFLPGVQF